MDLRGNSEVNLKKEQLLFQISQEKKITYGIIDTKRIEIKLIISFGEANEIIIANTLKNSDLTRRRHGLELRK